MDTLRLSNCSLPSVIEEPPFELGRAQVPEARVKAPAMRNATRLGMDVQEETIAVAILRPRQEIPEGAGHPEHPRGASPPRGEESRALQADRLLRGRGRPAMTLIVS